MPRITPPEPFAPVSAIEAWLAELDELRERYAGSVDALTLIDCHERDARVWLLERGAMGSGSDAPDGR